MRWTWWLISVSIAVVLLLYVVADKRGYIDRTKDAIGLGPKKMQLTKASKPICSQIIVPAGDCIPQHLANLPPDPGPAGMQTLEGIDSDKDGVRDDVQRYIVENYGHSERAVMALRNVAKGVQLQVKVGGDVSADEAKALAEQHVMKPVSCFYRSVGPQLRDGNAMALVVTEVTNTPERYAQKRKFEVKAANSVYLRSNAPTTELCGYDPAKLPN